MSDFLAPRSLKRNAQAISSPTERSARTAPISNKKCRHSRLYSLEHAYNPVTNSEVPIPSNILLSPMRLGNLPIPRLNFDTDSSDSESEAEAEPAASVAAPVVDSDASNNNTLIPQAAGLKTPHRPRAIPVRRFLAAPSSPPARVAPQSEITAREARRLRVRPAAPMAPRRKSLGALRQSSRVKDVAALFRNL